MYLENISGGIFSFEKHNSRLLFINVLLLFHSHSSLSISLSLSLSLSLSQSDGGGQAPP